MHLLDHLHAHDRPRTGDEAHGPCPWCGGEDRFVVFVNEGPGGTGRYWCRSAPGRGCGRSGDLIEFLQERSSMTFREAVKKAGLEDEVFDEDYERSEGSEGGGPEQPPPPTDEDRRGRASTTKGSSSDNEAFERDLEKDFQEQNQEKREERRRRRKEARRNLNEADQEMLLLAGRYVRTRRALRAVRRFIFLHADLTKTEEALEAEPPSPPSATARLAMIPDFVPKEHHPAPSDLPKKPYRPLQVTTGDTAWRFGGPGPLPGIRAIRGHPELFKHVDELYHAMIGGLMYMPRAKKKDAEEAQARINYLLDAASENS